MPIKPQAFLDLEKSLVAEILPRWAKIQNRIDPQIVAAIEQKNMAQVSDVLDTIKPEAFYQGKIGKINTLFKTAVVFGAALAQEGEVDDVTVNQDRDVMSISKVALEQYKSMVKLMVEQIKKAYKQAASDAIERLNYEERELTPIQKAAGNIKPINIPEKIAGVGKSIGQGQIDIASSLQMSRLSQFGFLNQATATGAVTYRVNEQLDGRTCEVCKRMHGKEFQVQPALAKVDGQIRLTDTDDIKLSAPFPKKDAASLTELETMTQEQLRARGFDTPPYHPYCRGLLQAVPREERTRPAALDQLGFPVQGAQQIARPAPDIPPPAQPVIPAAPMFPDDDLPDLE